MLERWAPVKGYEGFYEVSSMGRVRSLSRMIRRSSGGYQRHIGKVLRPARCKRYHTVGLSVYGGRKTWFVYRLVAESFLKRPSWAEQVNHKDHNSFNDFLDNLEWVTEQRNLDHSYEDGNHSKNIPVVCTNTGTIYRSMCQAAKAVGSHMSQIEKVCRGKMSHTHGYHFKILKEECHA
jgi:hypothetical protein